LTGRRGRETRAERRERGSPLRPLAKSSARCPVSRFGRHCLPNSHSRGRMRSPIGRTGRQNDERLAQGRHADSLTPTLSPRGRGRTVVCTVLLIGKAPDCSPRPSGERSAEGRVRGGPRPVAAFYRPELGAVQRETSKTPDAVKQIATNISVGVLADAPWLRRRARATMGLVGTKHPKRSI
jgi:hypothetical protein